MQSSYSNTVQRSAIERAVSRTFGYKYLREFAAASAGGRDYSFTVSVWKRWPSWMLRLCSWTVEQVAKSLFSGEEMG